MTNLKGLVSTSSSDMIAGVILERQVLVWAQWLAVRDGGDEERR